MSTEIITLLTLFLPIFGSLTIPAAGLLSKPFRSLWSVLLAAATAILPVIAPQVPGGGAVGQARPGSQVRMKKLVDSSLHSY